MCSVGVMKFLKPVTPGSRGTVLIDRSSLWKGSPERSLVRGKVSSSGRNSFGRITCRHKGGGCKKKYRDVDFKRLRDGIVAVVQRIEYDPNRSAFIALIRYDDGVLSYILAPLGLTIGSSIVSGADADILVGNSLPLSNIPVGSFVHNVELIPGAGGVFARSAGSYAQVIGRDGCYVLLKLRSLQMRLVDYRCRATIGVLSNIEHKNVKLGKAGRSRWKGVRPTVRGVAMNPIDHPHGGGEGKTSGGRHPVSPWGLPTKGKKTRKRNKHSNKYIKRVVSGR